MTVRRWRSDDGDDGNGGVRTRVSRQKSRVVKKKKKEGL
jgi:hypothetical protein